MAIHSKEDVQDNLMDGVYASTFLSISMPKHKIPELFQEAPSPMPADPEA